MPQAPLTLPADFFAKKKPEPPETLPADFFGTARKAGVPPADIDPTRNLSVPGLAKHLTKKFIGGIPQAITGIPGAVMGAAGAVDELVKAPTRMLLGQKSDLTNTKAIAEGAVKPLVTMGRNAAALATTPNPQSVNMPGGNYRPVVDAATPEDTAAAAEFGGAAVAGMAAPVVGSKILSTVKPHLSGAAKALYQKGLQPSPRTYSAPEIDAMVKTGLDNGLPISRGGLNKLDTLVNKLNSEVEAQIATNPTAPLSPTAIAQRTDSTVAKTALQVTPESDLSIIKGAKTEFLRRNQTKGKPAVQPQPTGTYDAQGNPQMTAGSPAVPPVDIPIEAATGQAMKKGTYQQLNAKAYGEVGTAATEAQKALARGIKEELESYFPEIKRLNAAEGKLFDLRPELEAAVNRLGNRRISVANVLNIMADPGITSRLAIILHKAGVPTQAISARMAALGATFAAGSASQKPQP